MNTFTNWQPNASIDNLLKRAEILNQIRSFFKKRGLLEVETPILSKTTVTDIHMIPFQTNFITPDNDSNIPMYMITSPEYHMKRLLAAGSGPIFQICKSFRNKEIGRYHNLEFTILEWYRPHYNMYQLIDETKDLLEYILGCNNIDMFSYQEVFMHYVGIDPLSIDKKKLYEVSFNYELNKLISVKEDFDILLQLLFTKLIEPNIGHDNPVFIYHFPASQAAMAKINITDPRVSDRFEVYFKGIELGNGFNELTDSYEQRYRFEQENLKRTKINLQKRTIDENLLTALMQDMPECSGIALGIDRLIMLALQASHINDVIAFSLERS